MTVPFHANDLGVDCLTESSCICRHGIQHRLYIRRRTSDDAQNFTSGSLLLQRFLEFVKQPNVLDSDHGLVGEGLEQLDLHRSKGAHLHAPCVQRANDFTLLSKWGGQEGAEPTE